MSWNHRSITIRARSPITMLYILLVILILVQDCLWWRGWPTVSTFIWKVHVFVTQNTSSVDGLHIHCFVFAINFVLSETESEGGLPYVFIRIHTRTEREKSKVNVLYFDSSVI